MRIHNGEKKHLCTSCGKRFFEPGHLAVNINKNQIYHVCFINNITDSYKDTYW